MTKKTTVTIDNPEFGYTPANLRRLRARCNLTQAQVAQITQTASSNAVSRWEADLDNPLHADMPFTKWVALLQHIQKT